jgi:long-chain acyl-CoA synthetase
MKKFGLSRYTLDCFWTKVVQEYGTRPSLALIGEEPITYAELGRRVDTVKSFLVKLGVKRQDKIILLGSSSPNWAIAYMAIMTYGAVAVPILEDFPEQDIDHIIKHSDAAAIFISENLAQNLNLPVLARIRHVIKLNDFSLLSGREKNKPSLWTQLQNLPDMFRSGDKSTRPQTGDAIQEEDLAEILYTSGTTGHSKGVMLTHKNLVSNLFEGPDLIKVIHPHSVVLSILPMAHAFGSTSAFLSIVYCGSCIYYLNKPPSPKVLLAAMQQVRPTILGAVPLVFEKIYHKQVVPIIAASRAMRLLAKTTMTKKILYRIIGKKINKVLGGRLDCVIIGGASFSPEVEFFMREGRIPYCCGYGLSECSPLVTFSSMKSQKTGSPGHAVTDTSIKIMDPDPMTGIGEICITGPQVMKGYYKNKEATEKVFTQDGWFISGDRGYLDKDGFLFITGRSKNVIIGPSGENIYPEVVEAKLAESIFVEEALVYQLENQLVARIYPNYAYIETLQQKQDEDAIASDIVTILESVRQEVNSQLPSFSRISRVIEQSSPFIKTPTNKIKRAEYVPGYAEYKAV